METLNRHQKLLIVARSWLEGLSELDPEYLKVLEAMELMLDHHDGNRNGGDPESSHQLGIFHYVRTMHKSLRNPKMVYKLIFLHDIIEDPNQKTGAFINPADIEKQFGIEVHDKVLKMSKLILGQMNSQYSLTTIFEDQDCSVAKGGDRVNNVSTMFGVFKQNRLEKYIKETVEEFLPRLKTARRMFHDQGPVYENMKLELVNQLTLINHIIEGHSVE